MIYRSVERCKYKIIKTGRYMERQQVMRRIVPMDLYSYFDKAPLLC